MPHHVGRAGDDDSLDRREGPAPHAQGHGQVSVERRTAQRDDVGDAQITQDGRRVLAPHGDRDGPLGHGPDEPDGAGRNRVSQLLVAVGLRAQTHHQARQVRRLHDVGQARQVDVRAQEIRGRHDDAVETLANPFGGMGVHGPECGMLELAAQRVADQQIAGVPPAGAETHLPGPLGAARNVPSAEDEQPLHDRRRRS